MKHIDTHRIYKQLVAKGLSSAQAEAQLDATEITINGVYESFIDWLRAAKEDFVSQKFLYVLGFIISTIGIALVALCWNMSVDMVKIKSDIQSQSTQIQQLSMKR